MRANYRYYVVVVNCNFGRGQQPNMIHIHLFKESNSPKLLLSTHFLTFDLFASIYQHVPILLLLVESEVFSLRRAPKTENIIKQPPQLSKWKAIILSSQMQEPCPLSTCGVWKQDFKRSESLCPFMAGLFPWPLSSVACTVADYTPVTLRILCKSPNQIEIVDKTTFGRNVTEVRWPVPLFRFLVPKLSYFH